MTTMQDDLDSLDADADEDVEEAWSKELTRRIESIDRGAELLVPWSVARRRTTDG